MLSYLQTIHLYFQDSQTSANDFNKYLEMIHNLLFQWKMNFNLDTAKQAQEVIFSCKTKKLPHLPLMFNNANVTTSVYQKHLAVILEMP